MGKKAEMVELPKDADGEPINVGDTVYDRNGRAWHVRGVTIGENQFLWEEYDVHGTSDTDEWRNFISNSLTHNRPDSLERIADELDEWCDSADVGGDYGADIRHFAERIRRLADKEEAQ